ncbi:MBL fold metallo-hydrolase [Peribacillus sp. TH27]|uniref:MBL fold metallo-hydrolase n=1 Tax=Peribacillus sp. TH27 TaxID=2798484 RepID=UPI0019135A5A|nr:MBL fold metallo-hydrolase [Peribacillus sp. TH27]MBK5461604.1 MBL fold metallo-hydrolase [Peribacillus sp. TH27]
MRMTKVGTVYQLSFMPSVFPVNCYFVEEENSLTLIDAALPYSTASIINAARIIGKPITRLIVTHAHDDHVGALDGIKALIPDLQVSISFRDALLLAGDSTLLQNETNSPIRGGVPKNIQTQPDLLLKEGDRIGSLEVIFSPGHTPGSISLLDTRNHSLIVGDALQTRGGTAVSGMIKPLFPFPAFATWNKLIAVESAKKLRSYKPSLLAVGHGKMLEHPGNSIDRAIVEAELKLQS